MGRWIPLGGVVLASVVALSVTGAGAKPPPSLDNCVRQAGTTRVVHFRTADRVLLAGAAFGRGPRGIVLVHESRGNVCQWKPWAVRLAAKGYHVLAIDLRTYGESQRGPSTSGGRRFDRDVVAAARELRKLGARAVVLVGASMGGGVVAAAAPQVQPPPAGVVSLSGVASWPGFDPLAGVQQSQAPLLLVAGSQDDPEFAKDAQQLFDASAAPDKDIRIVDSPDHGVEFVRYDPGVRTLVEDWLAAHLP